MINITKNENTTVFSFSDLEPLTFFRLNRYSNYLFLKINDQRALSFDAEDSEVKFIDFAYSNEECIVENPDINFTL